MRKKKIRIPLDNTILRTTLSSRNKGVVFSKVVLWFRNFGYKWVKAELLKGRILGSRIPEIFKKNSRHFWLRPKILG
jgi:hypothetical protein